MSLQDHPALEPLRRRLADEEAAYADALAALDRLAEFTGEPGEAEAAALAAELNELWSAAEPNAGAGLAGALSRRTLAALAPVLERQTRFNATLVRLLNAQAEAGSRRDARHRALVAALVRYAQRVEPVVDARDDARVAEAPSHAEQLLAEFEARLDEMRQRLEGLLALRDRVEAIGEEARAVRESLSGAAPTPEVARAAGRAAEASAYTAFENRFRGSRDEIRARQEKDVALFAARSPVADLGCGRGEFLELLRARGLDGRGVEANASAARECRAKGLDVVEGDLVAFLRAQPTGSLGGVFAAQVAEHLPPPVVQALLGEAHRALRPGGCSSSRR